MSKEKALDFLREKKGYLKKSVEKIQSRLQEERIWLSLDTIKDIKKIIKDEEVLNYQRLKVAIEQFNETPLSVVPAMKIKSKWQGANGKWLYSYVADESSEAVEYNEEAIKDYIAKNVTISPISPAIAHNDLMLNIYTTDKHIGADTARNSIYTNDYGREEVFDRHEKLVAEMLRQKEVHGVFKKCVFYDLGDALDGNNGQTTRGGHNLPQNMDSREQIDTFIEVTVQTIEQLIMGDIASEIWFVATSNDNHNGSFAHGALRSIQMYLQAKYPEIIKTFVTAKFVDHLAFGEHTFIFTHGKDDMNMKSGLPLTLDVKTEGFFNDYIDRKRIRTPYIHVIKGDLHQDAVTYGKRFRMATNLSMYGSSNWIHTNFGSGTSGVNYEIIPLRGGEPMRTRIIYQHDA
jgi:hypothetical protein